MDRRTFLRLGVFTPPILAIPKRFFFFGSSYKICAQDVKFMPFTYADGRRYMRGVVPHEHVINGHNYCGFWAVSVSNHQAYDNAAKKDVVAKLNWFKENIGNLEYDGGILANRVVKKLS